jgi:hypothetical protein
MSPIDHDEQNHTSHDATQAAQPPTQAPPPKSRATGPRTERGKLASRMNGYKHGKYAKYPVLRTESEIEYHLLTQSYLAEFNPETESQRRLVLLLASLDWRIARFGGVESNAIDSQLDSVPATPFAPLPDAQLQATTAAIDSALAHRALPFASKRETALIRAREITFRTLSNCRKLSLRSAAQPSSQPKTSPKYGAKILQPVESTSPAFGPNSDRTTTEIRTEPQTEVLTEIPAEVATEPSTETPATRPSEL